MSEYAYVTRRRGFWEWLMLKLSKCRREAHEQEQKAIIREIVKHPDAPVLLDGRWV